MSGTLHNLGATCALNSLVQLICHSESLRSVLLSSKPNTEDSGSLTAQLVDVIKLLYNTNQIVNPSGLLNCIFRMFPSNFRRGEEMDICELWMLISDKIADECKIPIVNVAETSARDKIQNTINILNNRSTSKWIRTIQRSQISIIQCNSRECADIQWNVEVMVSYELELPTANASMHISDLLLQNYKVDDLCDWVCDKCKKTGGSKQNKVNTMPTVLMVTIKRFHMSENGAFHKLNKGIDIDETIDIQSTGRRWIYKLCGVANHYGSYGGGHYNAFVRENDNWLCYDDNHRINMNMPKEKFLMDNKNAYLLCYEKA